MINGFRLTEKGDGKRGGEAANRFNGSTIYQIKNQSIQLFNYSTIQQKINDLTIARFNGLTEI